MMINVQKVNILHLNAANTYRDNNGKMHINANVGNPAVLSSYSARENRRKSNKTLPPFSWVYSDNLLE